MSKFDRLTSALKHSLEFTAGYFIPLFGYASAIFSFIFCPRILATYFFVNATTYFAVTGTLVFTGNSNHAVGALGIWLVEIPMRFYYSSHLTPRHSLELAGFWSHPYLFSAIVLYILFAGLAFLVKHFELREISEV